jgi:mono/diheme cytochrome c family protein
MRWTMILGLVVLAACGASQPRAMPPSDSAPASAPASSLAGDFDAMSPSEKAAFMRSTVFPKMKAEFQAFDASDFGDFTCATCHGADAANNDFRMPNPDLPKLDVSHDFAKDAAAHPRAVDFMLHKVMPAMAHMLGQPEYSESNRAGFGCMECHTPAT